MIEYSIRFIRHLEGMNNVNGTLGENGSADDRLSPYGEMEAESLRIQYMQKYGNPRYVYTSQANRAQQTARLLYPGSTLHVTDVLNERHWGDVTEVPRSRIDRKELDHRREKREVVLQRAITFLDGLFQLCKDTDVSAITHASYINTLLSYINGDEKYHLEDLQPLPNGHAIGLRVYKIFGKIKFKYDPDRSTVRQKYYL